MAQRNCFTTECEKGDMDESFFLLCYITKKRRGDPKKATSGESPKNKGKSGLGSYVELPMSILVLRVLKLEVLSAVKKKQEVDASRVQMLGRCT